MSIVIRNASYFEDSIIFGTIARLSPPLLEHDPYVYWVQRRCLSNYMYICEYDGTPAGFLTTIPISNEPKSLYFWQLGVLPDYRRNGIAQQLVAHALEEHSPSSFEVNIASNNIASLSIFRCAARSMHRDLVEINIAREPHLFSALAKYDELYFVTV